MPRIKGSERIFVDAGEQGRVTEEMVWGGAPACEGKELEGKE